MRNIMVLITAAAAVVAALAFPILSSMQLAALSNTVRQCDERTVTSPAQLEALLGQGRLILHVDADWSLDAVKSRPTVARFQQLMEHDSKLRGITFRRIDISDDDAVWRAAQRWLNGQECGDLVLRTGYGAILWVRSGRVIAMVDNARLAGARNLDSWTRQLMPTEQ